jgi:excinuclease ABC subunit C
MRSFDRKFGPEALAPVPATPGVYRFLDEAGAVVYVGKAKRLKRRLAQYRMAGRRKKHRKMRRVVEAAHSFVWQETESHLDACLLEIRLIQELRPPLNVSGTFSALYPFIGLGQNEGQAVFAFVSKAEEAPGLDLYGAFRSREDTAEAFYSLLRLLAYLGHKERAKSRGVHVFRALPLATMPLWAAFFRGESPAALSDLSLRLVESKAARVRAAAVQDDLRALRRFWRDEAEPLRAAMIATKYAGVYPVPKADRDPLFIAFREQLG